MKSVGGCLKASAFYFLFQLTRRPVTNEANAYTTITIEVWDRGLPRLNLTNLSGRDSLYYQQRNAHTKITIEV